MAFCTRQIIQAAAALFEEAIRSKQLSIETVWNASGECYRANASRLRQMLRNLMANAFKCTAQGSMRIQGNEIAASGDSSMLEFVVPYSVIGIPEDEQKLLFQPFSPADASITRKFGGTGRQRCSDAGMDDFLTTPINYRLLVATLEKFGKAPGGCLL